MHVAVWPALSIVPLHPSENVVVRGAITETVPPVFVTEFVTYIKPLLGLKAMPDGNVATGIVTITHPWQPQVVSKIIKDVYG